MKNRFPFVLAVLASMALPCGVRAQIDEATKQLSHGIFKELIEINTTDSVGSTTVAAQAMAKRLLDALSAAGPPSALTRSVAERRA